MFYFCCYVYVRFDNNCIVVEEVYFAIPVYLFLQTAMLLLRIDDIVSGTKKATGKEGSQSGAAPTTQAED